MSTTFDPALDITLVKPHPSNPRRKAAADEEMVDSIKSVGLVQPVIVAPSSLGGYVLLAGHRRVDGCRKAKLKTIPAIVRHDITTDAEQIEFAVVENVHRSDLSPIEEAEAFDQLRNLRDPSTRKNYTVPAIAKKTGRPVATVRDRLKLLKLSKKTTDALHKGQLTLGDALDLVSFEDDPTTQAALTKAAGTSEFKHKVETAKRRRKAQAAVDQLAKGLLEKGFAELDAGKAKDTYDFNRAAGDDVERIGWQGRTSLDECLTDMAGHDGCSTFVRLPGSTYTGPSLLLYCNDRAKHLTPDQIESDNEVKERQAEIDRQHQAAVAAAEARDVARTLRITSVLQLLEGVTMDSRFTDVLRALLPGMVWDLEGEDLEQYAAALGIDDLWGRYAYQRGTSDHATFEAHVDDIGTGSASYVARVVAALLLRRAETRPGWAPGQGSAVLALEHVFSSRYFELLEGIGHDMCEVDVQLRDTSAGEGDDS